MAEAVATIATIGKTIFDVGMAIASDPLVQTLAATAGQVALANAMRPDVPGQEISVPVRHRRPSRVTGTGRQRLAGAVALFEADTRFSYDVYLLHDGEVDAFEQWYLDDDPVSLVGDVVQAVGTKYEFGCVTLQSRVGLATETSYSAITTALGAAVWPSNARGDGIASVYQYVAAPTPEYFSRRLPSGMPTPRVVARLSKVYDPRDAAQDPADPSTWAWNENPICGLLFYLCFHESGPQLDYGRKVLPVIEYWTRAMDVCDEPVPLAESGSAARYAAGGAWTWDTAPSAVIGEYLNCCDGWMAPDSLGRLKVYAGRIYPAAAVLKPDHIRGWTLARGRRTETRADALEISYASPDHDYDLVQTDPWPDRETFALAEGEGSQPLTLKWVQTNSQARRLAKRYFAKRNPEASGTLLVDLLPDDGTDALGERYLGVLAGAGAPRFLQDALIEVQDVESDLINGLATITWISVDRRIDDWDADTEEGEGPESTQDAGGADLTAPEIISAEPEAFTIGETDFVRFLVVTDDNLDAASWQLRYRINGELSWTLISMGVTDLGSTLALRSGLITPGFEYEVQIRFVTASSAESDWGEEPPVIVDMTGF